MADALISPAVGGVFWTISAFTAAAASKKIKAGGEDSRNVLTGVLAAFVFAAQMINFSIPGTGSSGHIGGGILLAILLGRDRAFLSMTVILTVQALVFADGGLLALGCNIFNLGFLPCCVAYPFVYKKLAASGTVSTRAVFAASIAASVAGLELGALFVVLQTIFSGITLIPFALFTALMLPVHLAIAVVEGLITAMIIVYVRKNEPSLLAGAAAEPARGYNLKKIAAVFAIAALLTGGVFSWYASPQPDGLEWSLERAAENWSEASPLNIFHSLSRKTQEMTAFLPNYAFKNGEERPLSVSASGVIGSLVTLFLSAGAAIFLGKRRLRG